MAFRRKGKRRKGGKRKFNHSRGRGAPLRIGFRL